jgi:Tfp pilus assembly protein PilN
LARINLYNYRNQEIYYRKLRVYAVCSMSLLIALIVNAIIFSYLELGIMRQETRNSFLQTQINIIDHQITPVKDFKKRVADIENKIKLIKAIEKKQDDAVAFIQNLSKSTPGRLYFTNIDVNTNSTIPVVNFKGVAASPLYIAHFLDSLRESGTIFINPILKSNDTSDQNNYNFEISAGFRPDLDAEMESYGS